MNLRRVVRVRFTKNGRTYAYRCHGCKIGDFVDIGYGCKVRVIGYGRRGYIGTLKYAEKVKS